MTKRLLIISILLIATIFSCQKKMFKTIRVTGRLIDQSTKLPLGNTKVALYTDDATTGHYSGKNSIQLDLKTTNDDGTFELNSMASRVGNYCIRSRNSLTNSYEFNTTSKKIDIGDVIAPK